jgi:tRNA pseudouridine(38-40) synthase
MVMPLLSYGLRWTSASWKKSILPQRVSSLARLSTLHSGNVDETLLLPSDLNIVEKDTERGKRKVAIVAGYVGTGYYGLQLSTTVGSDGSVLPTIEGALWKALIAEKLVKPENTVSLKKIDWNRSSRTDKGVHAKRIVISAKLEIPNQLLDSNLLTVLSKLNKKKTKEKTKESVLTPTNLFCHYPNLVEAVNRNLPEQIRIFSISKVNRSFNAKDDCMWRSYEYFLPLELLLNSDQLKSMSKLELEKVVDTLNVFLQQFEGTHGFHNFHRLSSRDLRGTSKKPTSTKQDDATITSAGDEIDQSSISVDEVIADEEFEEVEEGAEMDNVTAERLSAQYFGDQWSPQPRSSHSKTKGVIYQSRATLVEAPLHNSDSMSPFIVKINFKAQFFLLQ